jgi:hypothetical protein
MNRPDDDDRDQPARGELDQLVRQARRAARECGMRPTDVREAAATAREEAAAARRERLEAELRALQEFWGRVARERGVLSEEDL